MTEDLGFFIALMLNGVMIGLMYALIALGFVLVYKATDAINFAQGEFVMLAGFIVAGVAGLDGRAVLWRRGADRDARRHDRLRLRPGARRAAPAARPADRRGRSWRRSGSPPCCAAPRRCIFGAETRARRRCRSATSRSSRARSRCRRCRWSAPACSLLFLAAFTWFFLKSRMGVAMRAVADNQQVAMAMGINVERYFALAWAMAGIVSALGGIVWGTHARRRQPAGAGRPEGVPGGDPGRARFDRAARWSAA